MGLFLNTLVAIAYTTVVLGSIFAASSVSLSLIYGTMRFLNLAHGSFLVIVGYVAWVFAHYLGLPLYLAIVFATGFGFALGLFTYFIMLKPLLGIGSPKWDIATIIASVGLAIFLEAAILEIFGPRLKALPHAIEGSVIIGTTVIRYNALFIGAVAIAMLVITNWYLTNSRNGIALRAVASDVDAAYLMGIPSSKMFASAVAISGALATSAGALLGSFYLLKPDRGLDPMMTAIVVVVFGGLGSIKGTIIAAYIVGFIQAFVALTIGIKWSLPVLFAFMIVVLIFRPYGLYGESQQKRI